MADKGFDTSYKLFIRGCKLNIPHFVRGGCLSKTEVTKTRRHITYSCRESHWLYQTISYLSSVIPLNTLTSRERGDPKGGNSASTSVTVSPGNSASASATISRGNFASTSATISPGKRVNLRSECMDQLDKSLSLLRKGCITQEQYDKLKDEILKDMSKF